ncbi:MAG: thioredoxin family protein [Chitinophagales bacterium]|nr:thioredoxin family protein [Chitinophagales bacterium]
MKQSIKFLGIIIILITVMTSASTPGYKVGDKADDFKLKNIDGKMISLADYKDAKGFIVIFTCNHCPYAKAYESRVMALNSMYASKGFPVIAINPNDPKVEPEDSYDNMMAVAKSKGYTFPYLLDESQSVAKEYGAQRTPHVFVLNKTDKGLQVSYIGAIDDNTEDPSLVQHHYVEDAVNALLGGKQVPVTQTKAIGCGIKWKS